jgi:hypothetical protein
MTIQKTDEEEVVWSAIRYLDPDNQAKDRMSEVATVFGLFGFVITVMVWVLLCFRGL